MNRDREEVANAKWKGLKRLKGYYATVKEERMHPYGV